MLYKHKVEIIIITASKYPGYLAYNYFIDGSIFVNTKLACSAYLPTYSKSCSATSGNKLPQSVPNHTPVKCVLRSATRSWSNPVQFRDNLIFIKKDVRSRTSRLTVFCFQCHRLLLRKIFDTGDASWNELTAG